MSKVLPAIQNEQGEPVPASNRRLLQESYVRRWINIAGVYVLVAILFVVGRAVSPEFLTTVNLVNILRAVTLLGIVAAGVTFITYSGHYVDLSIPVIMALSGIVTITALPLGFAAALFCGVAAGIAIGAINGFAVGYLRLNPIIWTLASASIVQGLIRWGFGGNQVYPNEQAAAGRNLIGLYTATLPGGVPLTIVILAAIIGGGWLLMNRTSFGAKLRLTGSAYEAARMTGINVRGLTALAFVVSAFATAVAGILLTSLNRVGAPYIGSGYDFAAITAVVVGGVALSGGRGSILGALGGVLVIGLLNNILTLIGVGTFGQIIAQGCVFVIAVGASSYSLRRSGRDDS